MREGSGGRFGSALGTLTRTLRDDLWTARPDPLPRSWRDWQPVLLLLVAFVVFPIGIIGVNEAIWQYGLGQGLGVVLGAIPPLAVVCSVQRPVRAWWAVTVTMVLVAVLARPQGSQMYPWTGSGIALHAAVLFVLALRMRPRIAAEALGISVLAGAVCTLAASPVHNPDLYRAAVIFCVTVLVGAALRGRREARTQLEAQTELTAEERARRTLLEERTRIARELHDVVAHHMSVISIQAQVAPHLVAEPSEALRENLIGIRANAVDALAELRRVLGVLRSEDDLSSAMRHVPQPTLDRLDELVDNVRGAGLDVETRITGERRALSPGVELSAFRIVQEALSNVLRHAPGATIRVEVGYQATGLALRVANTAPPAAGVVAGVGAGAEGGGHGLLGMRERVAMLGGEFADGPIPGGGYEVVARLPLGSGT
ncbi:sensor histidine kinase [Embleya scabrispora]|uniref:sensor histidine kinase n=1 Tax=Embleya scabrispora TaxID=159449 RepID=UPI001F44B99C|nr:histidine kinase [Embleya scabrispora]